jgi:hypothetical protein
VGGVVQAQVAVGTDNTVYVSCHDFYLYSISSLGTLKWKFSTGGIPTAPILGADHTIYVGSNNGYMYALHPTGTLQWQYLVSSSGIAGAPSMGSDGTIYVGAYDDYFYAIGSRYPSIHPTLYPTHLPSTISPTAVFKPVNPGCYCDVHTTVILHGLNLTFTASD